MKKPFGRKISSEPFEYCKGTTRLLGGYETGTIVVNGVPAVLGAKASVGKFGGGSHRVEGFGWSTNQSKGLQDAIELISTFSPTALDSEAYKAPKPP